MTLKEAIKYVKESCKEEGLIPDSNTVLDVACRIFISQNISQSKRDNIKAIQNQPGSLKEAEKNQGKDFVKGKPPFQNSGADRSPITPSPDNSPTLKQINYLKRLGVKETPKTKQEAREVIKLILEEKEEGGY